MRRSWEQRAREGRVTCVLGVALCARLGGERSAILQVDPPQVSHLFFGGTFVLIVQAITGAASLVPGLDLAPVRALPLAPPRSQVPRCSTLFAACLRPPSSRYLEPQRHPGRSWRSPVCSCRWGVPVCLLCTGCDARVHGLRSDRCRCRICTHDIPGDARAELGSIYELRYVPGCFEHVMTHRNR